jgi:hypothetical protein
VSSGSPCPQQCGGQQSEVGSDNQANQKQGHRTAPPTWRGLWGSEGAARRLHAGKTFNEAAYPASLSPICDTVVLRRWEASR